MGYKMPMTSQPIRHPVRILGIDPGLRRTGWGVIEVDGNRLGFVGCGSVEPPDSLPLASRLLAIHEGLAAVLGDFKRFRLEMVEHLTALARDNWKRTGKHPNWGRLTIRQGMERMVRHTEGHLDQVRELMAKAAGT